MDKQDVKPSITTNDILTIEITIIDDVTDTNIIIDVFDTTKSFMIVDATTIVGLVTVEVAIYIDTLLNPP